MIWKLLYLPEAEKDYRSLAHNQQLLVDKAIQKVKSNPLAQDEGGYGKPLGYKSGTNLTGYYKIKLRGIGIRIVYKLIRTETQILVIVIGMREDEEVYEIAARRIKKHDL